MGKSIRSKKRKRLRTIKRELVEPYYDAKELKTLAILDAARAAPKIELPQKREEMEDNVPLRGRTPAVLTNMEVSSEAAPPSTDHKLKAKGGIRKGGRSGRHNSKRELKGKRKKSVKF